MRTTIACLLLASACSADDLKAISLERVWSYEMPGTQHLHRLLKGKPYDGPDRSAHRTIDRSFPVLPKGKKSGPILLVEGHRFEALKNASQQLAEEGEEVPGPTGRKVSLLFFAHPGKGYVHIKKIECHEDDVKIYYTIAPNRTLGIPHHIALIPLPPVRGERLSVQVVDPPEATEKDLLRICRSATFRLGKSP